MKSNSTEGLPLFDAVPCKPLRRDAEAKKQLGQILAFPISRHAPTVNRLETLWHDLLCRSPVDKAYPVFASRHLGPIKRRLKLLGLPRAEVDKEMWQLQLAIRELYDRRFRPCNDGGTAA